MKWFQNMSIDTKIMFINLSIHPKAEFFRRIKEGGGNGWGSNLKKKKGRGKKTCT